MPDDFHARFSASGRVYLYRIVNRRAPLGLERGRAWNNDNAFDSGYINAASIFLGLDTPLGPLNFSYGFNDEREKALYLNLGKSF